MAPTKSNRASTKPSSQSSWASVSDGVQVMLSPQKGSRFQKAVRTQGKARVGLYGPNGAGKTQSLLEIASGLSSKVALIDTEDRAWIYGDQYDFGVSTLHDHSPESWLQAIRDAEDECVEVLILDNFSHAWIGRNGLQEYHQSLITQNKLDSFQAWNLVGPIQRSLLEAIQHSSLHVLCSFYAKTEYERVPDPRNPNKTKIEAVGYGPIWRNGIVGIFDFFGYISPDHELSWSEKDTNNYFSGEKFLYPTSEVGKRLNAWCGKGQLVQWSFKSFHHEGLKLLREKNAWASADVRALLSLYNCEKWSDIKSETVFKQIRQSLSMHSEQGLAHAQYLCDRANGKPVEEEVEQIGEF